MADSDITGLTELTAPAVGDWLAIDDTSDSGTTKKIDYGDISGTQTVLRGDVMYIWPTSLGIYANIQAVFDAVPFGGTALLMADLDLNAVNSNNPISITTPISVSGWGWGRDFTATNGTKISNAAGGTDCLVFDNEDVVDGQRRMDGMKISNLVFWHRGSGAAIEINGSAWAVIEDVLIDCLSTGAIGVDIPPSVGTINTFFIRGARIQVRAFTDYGIRDHGAGTQNTWEDIYIGDSYTSVTTAGISLLGSDKRLLRGECAASGSAVNTKTGIEILPTGTTSYPYGTGFRVDDFLFEGSSIQYCIVVGGDIGGYAVTDSFFSNNQCQAGNDHILYYFKSSRRNTVDGAINYAGVHARDGLTVASFSTLAYYNVINLSNPTMAGQASLVDFGRVNYIDLGVGNLVRMTTPMSDVDLYAVNAVIPEGVQVQVMAPLNDRATQKVFAPMLRKDGKFQGTFLDPDSVTSANCILWLDADTGIYSDAGTTPVVDADPIYQWDDVDVATRTSNSFIQTTLGNRPDYDEDVLGTGNPGLHFTSANAEQLIGPAIALGGGTGTIVTVATIEGTGAQSSRGLIGRGAASSPIDYTLMTQQDNSPDRILVNTSLTDTVGAQSGLNCFINSNFITSLHPDGVIQPTIVSITRYDKNHATATRRMWCNGTTATNNVLSGDWNATTEAATWRIGTTSFGSFHEGWIYAIALFDGDLSDQEVEDLGFYFMNKYNGINSLAS